MEIELTVKHKSLTPSLWTDIPNFSILTGVNGAGKSQLLDFIGELFGSSASYDDDHHYRQSQYILRGMKLRKAMQGENGIVWGFTVSPAFLIDEVIHLKSEWKLTNCKPINDVILQNIKETLYDKFLKQDETNLGIRLPRLHAAFNHVKEILGKTNSKISYEEFVNQLPNFYYYNQEDLTQQISIIFYEYFLKKEESNQKLIEDYDFLQEYGIPPWKELNALIEEFDLPFECTYPKIGSLSKNFQLELVSKKTSLQINFDELSLGESVLISIAFYIFIANKRNVSFKLLLLDEPDAHLHPSMTNQFLKVVYNILVKKYEINVILSTHSPTTVALAPEEYDCGIFEMLSNPTQIIKISREQAIASLTNGLITVSPVTKYILIEGVDDKSFYEAIYRQLLTNKFLSNQSTLAFIAGTNKESVAHWSNGLRNAGLSNTVRGVIDKDNSNSPSDGIYCLERYSIENYLLDPIIIFATGDKLPDTLKKFDFRKGEEEKLKLYENSRLQEIADIILKTVEVKVGQQINLTEEDKTLIEVKFINGKILKYPKWLIKERGKTLRPIFQSTFAHGNILNNNNLILSLNRLIIIPEDLLNLFKQIQK